MENLLKKILERKRSNCSSSGESSTSPDTKKAKSGDINFAEGVEEHEADGEIFTSLNMAVCLHKTLEYINQKWEKVDAIQITVNDVQLSLKEQCRSWNALKQPPTATKSFKAAEKQQQKSSGEN